MNGWKAFGIGVVVFISLGILTLLSTVLGVFNFGVETGKEVIKKTVTADKIIYNYDNFYNIYEGLKGIKNNIEATDKEIKSIEDSYTGQSKDEWAKSDVERYSFIKDTRNGYVQNYNRNASDYNSNAQKLTSKYFKDWNLPDRIELIY